MLAENKTLMFSFKQEKRFLEQFSGKQHHTGTRPQGKGGFPYILATAQKMSKRSGKKMECHRQGFLHQHWSSATAGILHEEEISHKDADKLTEERQLSAILSALFPRGHVEQLGHKHGYTRTEETLQVAPGGNVLCLYEVSLRGTVRGRSFSEMNSSVPQPPTDLPHKAVETEEHGKARGPRGCRPNPNTTSQ